MEKTLKEKSLAKREEAFNLRKQTIIEAKQIRSQLKGDNIHSTFKPGQVGKMSGRDMTMNLMPVPSFDDKGTLDFGKRAREDNLFLGSNKGEKVSMNSHFYDRKALGYGKQEMGSMIKGLKEDHIKGLQGVEISGTMQAAEYKLQASTKDPRFNQTHLHKEDISDGENMRKALGVENRTNSKMSMSEYMMGSRTRGKSVGPPPRPSISNLGGYAAAAMKPYANNSWATTNSALSAAWAGGQKADIDLARLKQPNVTIGDSSMPFPKKGYTSASYQNFGPTHIKNCTGRSFRKALDVKNDILCNQGKGFGNAQSSNKADYRDTASALGKGTGEKIPNINQISHIDFHNTPGYMNDQTYSTAYNEKYKKYPTLISSINNKEMIKAFKKGNISFGSEKTNFLSENGQAFRGGPGLNKSFAVSKGEYNQINDKNSGQSFSLNYEGKNAKISGYDKYRQIVSGYQPPKTMKKEEPNIMKGSNISFSYSDFDRFSTENKRTFGPKGVQKANMSFSVKDMPAQFTLGDEKMDYSTIYNRFHD